MYGSAFCFSTEKRELYFVQIEKNSYICVIMADGANMCWFAMRATYGRNLMAQRILEVNKIESFVPMRKRTTKMGRRIKTDLVPVVRDLIFVLAERNVIQEVKGDIPYLHYITRPAEGKGSSYNRQSSTRSTVNNTGSGTNYQRKSGASERGAYRSGSSSNNSNSRSTYNNGNSSSRSSYSSGSSSSSRSSYSSGSSSSSSRSSGGGGGSRSGGGRR